MVNLGQLQSMVDAGKLTAGQAVDEDALIAAGATKRKRNGVRLLGKGQLTTALNLTLSGAARVVSGYAERIDGANDRDKGNWTYKVGGNWTVNDWLRFRGS